MNTIKYKLLKLYLLCTNSCIQMERHNFKRIGKGWLINIYIAVDSCVKDNNILQKDVDYHHGRLLKFVKSKEWLLDNGDGFQMIIGNQCELKQYYKQHCTKIDGKVRYSDKFKIYSAQQGDAPETGSSE